MMMIILIKILILLKIKIKIIKNNVETDWEINIAKN